MTTSGLGSFLLGALAVALAACSSGPSAPGVSIADAGGHPPGTTQTPDGGGDGGNAVPCDPPCGPQATCCVVALPSGPTQYGCVDTRWNADHCGSCGNACPADTASGYHYCFEGTCSVTAPALTEPPGDHFGNLHNETVDDVWQNASIITEAGDRIDVSGSTLNTSINQSTNQVRPYRAKAAYRFDQSGAQVCGRVADGTCVVSVSGYVYSGCGTALPGTFTVNSSYCDGADVAIFNPTPDVSNLVQIATENVNGRVYGYVGCLSGARYTLAQTASGELPDAVWGDATHVYTTIGNTLRRYSCTDTSEAPTEFDLTSLGTVGPLTVLGVDGRNVYLSGDYRSAVATSSTVNAGRAVVVRLPADLSGTAETVWDEDLGDQPPYGNSLGTMAFTAAQEGTYLYAAPVVLFAPADGGQPVPVISAARGHGVDESTYTYPVFTAGSGTVYVRWSSRYLFTAPIAP